ncbi:hypothetical protein At15955_50480 (plasmid) [Agrobacterium tumefaciens]|uniref:hypothetical protein n=1 Tax=Agrobacterium tumefaciens TaxID=358 RepID=UPI0006187504|nr:MULTISPECIES: hypothetical protein [Rhizobium/Agrobacterium group]AKC10650.1 hypothetical protein Ach5_48870 [Agrobacterium tumefaciens]AYM20033.1 hypothetical protein At15955_50480 [Agrobacterium tumefaciens]AYM71336.1 hypothetical protein AtA6_51200 [Agrobacterium tumefaciens]NSZ25150.1 hypothetical protein [Agrobacterium tumefaciens]NTB21240.1 hypothetical protein [Agrobacterium tumefaciens]
MCQQTKPFIVERKPSRKPKPDAPKPSIWGRLDTDTVRGPQQQLDWDQRDMDHAATTGGGDRA